MKLLNRLPMLVFALVLLALVGFAIAADSIPLLVVAGTLAIISWYVTEGPRGRILPRWVSSILVIAVALHGLIDFLQHSGSLPSVLGRFTVWLTIIKLYERRTARDHLHLMSLSLLLMLVGCLLADELMFGVVLGVYSTLGLYVLLLYQLYSAHEQAMMARRRVYESRGQDAPRVRPTAGRGLIMQFRLLAAGIATVGLVLSVMLFLIVPRTGARGFITQALRARTSGFADTIRLDGPSRISESLRLVGELVIEDGAEGSDVSRVWYLRGAVLDRYERGAWRASPGATVTVDGAAALVRDERVRSGPLVTQRLRFHAGTERVFASASPVAVDTGLASPLRYEPARQTLETLDGERLHAYTVMVVPDADDGLMEALARRNLPATSPSAGFRRVAPEIATLARGILQDAGLPGPAPGRSWAWNRRAAQAIADHLRGGGYEYTLDRSDVIRNDEDPIVEFLFESQRGHCEFFATAHALLCQAIGIDTRVVTGYAVTEYDVGVDRFIIRERNAHAWVEVRTGQYRFDTFDPTPPGTLRPQVVATRSMGERMAGWYQRIEGLWTSRVIGFDAHSQSRLVEVVDANWLAKLTGFARATRRWMSRLNRAFYFGPAGYIWLGIVALTAIIAVITAYTLLRRRRAIRRRLQLAQVMGSDARRMTRQLDFYLDLLLALDRKGRPKPEWQPPLAFADALSAEQPGVARIVARVGELYYAGRYAGRRLTRDEVREAKDLVHELDGEA